MKPSIGVLSFLYLGDVGPKLLPVHDHTFSNLFEMVLFGEGPAEDTHSVGPLKAVAWEFKRPCEVSIIGYNEEAFGEVIKTANGDDVRNVEAEVSKPLEDRYSAFRVEVGSDHVLRFVEEPNSRVLFDGGIKASLS
jgi:hypothetical protein